MTARLRTWCATLCLLATAATAAEDLPLPLSSSGLLLGDLAVSGYRTEADGSTAAIDLTGVALDEVGPGDYLLTGLPDAVPGQTWTYWVAVRHGDDVVWHVWPTQTRTPQSVVNRIGYQASPKVIAQGATIPAIEAAVSGLSSDPTGATATFTLYTAAGFTAVLSDLPAELVDADQALDGTWSLVVRHAWLAAETASLDPGEYVGRFWLTLPSGDTFPAPVERRQLTLQVVP